MKPLRPYMVGGAAGIVIGLLLGWFLWHSEPAREGPAFEKALPSGGIIVQRDPDAPVPAAVKRAAKEAGGKLERSISVTVQPRPIAKPGGNYAIPIQTPAVAGPRQAAPSKEGAEPAAAAPECECAPVTVELGLVRMPDRTRRVVATSPDGDVIAGMDIPLDAAAAARSLNWAAGATYSPQHREFGAFLDRDLGPLRVGVEVQQRREGLTAVVRAGIRF